MNGEAQKLMTRGRGFWGALNSRQRLALMAGAAAAIGTVLYMSLRGAVNPYEPLATGLSVNETKAVEEELKSAGIPYEKEAGGAILKVPPDKLTVARVFLASKGVSHKGTGFEIFDKQRFGTSSFVEQINYRRALQGELERSIGALDVVEGARVHIAISEKSLFRGGAEAPSASVMVKLLPGRVLSPTQIRGVVNLVAFSIPGLHTERVSLVDDTGRVLSQEQDGPSFDAQRDLEDGLARRVRALIERVVGEGHAEVQVSAEMDFSKETISKELYDPEAKAIRSEQRMAGSIGAQTPVTGGVAGVQGNLPGAPAPTTTQGPTGGQGTMSETKNYEVSKTVQVSQGASPKLKRIHVAVLVNGMPDKTVKVKPGKEKEVPRVPLKEAELAQLVSVAKKAVGFDESRGDTLEIQNASFAPLAPLPPEVPPKSEWPAWLESPKNRLLLKGVGLVVGILAAFAALIVLIRTVRLRSGGGEAEILATLPPNMPIRDIEEHMGSMDQSMFQAPAPPPMELPPVPSAPKARDLAATAAKRDPTRSVRVVSNWIAEAAGGGAKG